MSDVLNKTLEELDGEIWGEPEWNSYVVTNCHLLRRVPLEDFTIEDLRLVVGQCFSLEYLVPLALEQLERNPLAAGNFYEGDLLRSISDIPAAFWEQNPELQRRWRRVLNTVTYLPVEILNELPQYLRNQLSKASHKIDITYPT